MEERFLQAMIASAIKISRDLSTAQMLIVIISRNMIKRITSTLIRKVYVKHVEQSVLKSCDCRKDVELQGYWAHKS